MKGKTITTIAVTIASVVGVIVAIVVKLKKKVSTIGRNAGKTC